jgi:FMN phosphatase YigB (HAD superfamily)
MIKQIIVSTLIPFSVLAMRPAQYPHKAKIHSVNKKIDLSKTIFAFDLDEVVLIGREEAYKKWLADNWDFADAINEVKIKYNLSDAGDIIHHVVQRYPYLQEKAQQFQNVIFKASVIPGTIKIIDALHKKGYGIIAASNMTTTTYQAMVDNGTLPTQFSRDIFFVATNPLNKKADGKYHEKPNQEYYLNLKRYIKTHYPTNETVIFMDDKLKNALGAQNIPGIISIHFKSPEQLRADLIAMGIEI